MLKGLSLACVGVLFGIAPMAHATVIFSENFSAVTPGTFTLGQAVGTGFTVTAGSIDAVGAGFFGALCVGGETAPCVDLNGSSAGTLATSGLVLIPGNYLLSFVLNGSQRGVDASTTVSLGALFTQTYITPSATANNMINQAITVASGTTAVLSFASNTPGFIGSLLDNVSLSTEASAIPEPSSLLLCLGALPLAWKLSRRRT